MEWKKLFCALSVAFAVSASVAGAATLSVSSAEGKPGETVNVNLTTDSTFKDVAGLQFTIDFGVSDPSNAPVLSVQDADTLEPGALFTGSMLETNLSSPTRLTVGILNPKNKSGAGTVVTIPFYIPDNAPAGAAYTLHISKVEANTKDSKAVTVNAKDGTVRVKLIGGTTGGTTPPPINGIVLSKASGLPGSVVPVDIAATDAIKSVASMQITLQFDPSLTATNDDVALGGLVSGLLEANAKVPGKLTLGLVSTKGKDGPGVLARVYFHLPANAKPGSIYPIKVSSVELLTNTTAPIPSGATDGEIDVASGPADLPKIDGGLVDVKSLTAGRNGIARVEVEVNNKIANLSGAKFTLVFTSKTPADAPDLELLDGAAAGSVLSKAAVTVNSKISGQVTVGITSTQSASGPGTLVTIPFRVKNAKKGTTYGLEIHDLTLSVNDADMTSATNGGSLTVTGRKKGDVAGDGDDKVTPQDATVALQAVVGVLDLTPDQFDAADLNGDGKLSISEVTRILKAAVGLESLDG